MAADLNITGEVVVSTEKVEGAFDRVGNKAAQMGAEVTGAANKAGQAVDGIGDGAGAAAEKFTRAESRISAAIKKSTNELQLLGKTASQRLEFNIADRGLDPAKFEPALQKLREVEARALAAQKAASGSLEKIGISAGQTAAALRGVPAQFQDIIVSLQGGQAPMTVFLQQGSQLATMFGSAGAAAKALGGYVLGLVNPFTVAAAAAIGLAVAYEKGANEAREFSKALILSGNASGATANQLQTYAASISKVVGTQSAAAEALAEFTRTGRVGTENLEQFARAALVWEKATGQAVGKTVEQFAELAKAPVDASVRLNEQMNYLTTDIYKQIKALEEQGKATEAANLAQRTFADTIETRGRQVVENLGFIETAWRRIGEEIKRAGSFVAGIGRDQTGAEQLASLRQQLATREARGPLNSLPSSQKAFEDGNKVIRDRIALIERLNVEQAKTAAAEGERARLQRLYQEYDKQGDQFKQKAAKRDEEIERARIEGQELVNAKLITEAQLRERLASIRKKYAETGSAGTGENEVAGFRARIVQQEAINQRLRAQIATGNFSEKAEPTQAEKDVIRLQKELETSITGVARARKLEALEAAKTLAQREAEGRALNVTVEAAKRYEVEQAKQLDALLKSAGAIEDQAEAQERANDAFGKSKTAVEQVTLATLKLRMAEADAFSNSTPQYLAALQSKIDAQQRYVDALQRAEFVQARQRLEEAGRVGAEETKTLELELSLLGQTQLVREQILAQRRAEVNLAKELAAIDKLNLGEGADAERQRQELKDKARANYVVEANNGAAKAVAAEWERTSDSINQSLTDALLRGFESGKGFAENFRDTVVNMFKTLVLQPTVKLALAPVAAALTGISPAASAGGVAGMASSFGGLASGASLFGSGFSSGLTAWGSGGSVTSLLGQGSNLFAGGLANGLGTIAGALGPIIAGVGLLASLARSGETRQGAGYQVNNGTAQFGGGPSGGAINQAVETKLVQDTFDGINAILKRVGSAASVAGFEAGLEQSTKGRGAVFAGGSLSTGQSFGQTYAQTEYNRTLTAEQAATEFGQQLQKATIEALKAATDIPVAVRKALESDADATSILAQVDALVTSVSAFGAVVGLLPFENLKNLAFDASAGLIAAAGGLDALKSNISTYYQNFYTEEERTAQTIKNLQATFKDLGIAFPDLTQSGEAARQQFRDIVDSLDVTSESGQKAYATLTGVSGAFAEITPIVEATKAAIEQMGPTLEEAKAGYQSLIEGLQDQIAGITDTFGDIEGAMRELEPPALKLVEAWRANKTQIEEIQAAINAATGTRKPLTALEQLAETAGQLEVFGSAIQSIDDAIFDLKVGKGGESGLAALKQRESDLWSGLGEAVARGAGPEWTAAITKTTLDRIKLEGQIEQSALQNQYDEAYQRESEIYRLAQESRKEQIDTLRAQISGYERLKDVAEGIRQFTDSLRSSNLSPLNFEDQLSTSRSLYERTLAQAQTGDENALSNLQGNARAYLEEARAYFASSGAYADIFAAVTGQLDEFGATGGSAADAQIAILNAQASSLEAINTQAPELRQAVVDTSDREIEALGAVRMAFVDGQSYLKPIFDDMVSQQKETVKRLESIIDGQAAQIREQGAAIDKLETAIQTNTTAVNELTGETKKAALAIPGNA